MDISIRKLINRYLEFKEVDNSSVCSASTVFIAGYSVTFVYY